MSKNFKYVGKILTISYTIKIYGKLQSIYDKFKKCQQNVKDLCIKPIPGKERMKERGEEKLRKSDR